MTDRIRVALFFGGQSAEHGVACLTAASVVEAIDTERFDVVAVGITRSGRWRRMGVDEVAAMKSLHGQLPSVGEDGLEAVLFVGDDGQRMIATRQGEQLLEQQPVDVALALLHGPFGEDGTIQGLFEVMGLPYVGSGVTSSAVAMDKHLMKVQLSAAGVPVGPYSVIQPAEWLRDPAACLDAASSLHFPVFVKPARGGSSIGITKVDEPSGLTRAIEAAREHDPKVIIEQGVMHAREIECAVLQGRGQGEPRTSPVGEIRMLSGDSFYDFDAKYLPEAQVALDIPAELDDDIVEKVQRLASRTFTVMGAEGLARVDTFVTDGGHVLVNEINTMPGFTEFSMFPQLWRQGGLSYAELIGELIELALARPIGLR